jgi:hypothetical protein
MECVYEGLILLALGYALQLELVMLRRLKPDCKKSRNRKLMKDFLPMLLTQKRKYNSRKEL